MNGELRLMNSQWELVIDPMNELDQRLNTSNESWMNQWLVDVWSNCDDDDDHDDDDDDDDDDDNPWGGRGWRSDDNEAPNFHP